MEGDKLYAEIAWTEEGQQLIRSGNYRYFTPEFVFITKTPKPARY